MPRKKSAARAAKQFVGRVTDTLNFVSAVEVDQSQGHVSRIYDSAVIALYRDFEDLVLDVLVAAINNDTTTISTTLGVKFPRHMTDEVCYYLVTGPSYFDFKGRSGLIRRVKQYVPENHYLVDVLKDQKYRQAIDRLCALRNYAAHDSPQSKKAALEVTGQARMRSAGAWLKVGSRLSDIAIKLQGLAKSLEDRAPY